MILIQHTIIAPFKIEYAYISEGAQQSRQGVDFYFGESLTKLLASGEKVFDEKFSKAFQLEEKGYTPDQIDFGKMLLGNMLGGLGYFHGTSIEDHALVGIDEEVVNSFTETSQEEDDYFATSDEPAFQLPSPKPEEQGPFTLFTGVPSRPFFPRGFLWDSGFDHHLIEAFDPEISLDIITHWANLIDDSGWLAREQILGEEARSKVPAEFQIQYPHYANPPTLITALEKQVEIARIASMTSTWQI
jgi:mannosyl-oligosaccharide glucosidase